MSSIVNKNILLGISGGIAAYKSADLVRQLRLLGANVKVVMTEAAKAFITPLTLQALSGYPVYDDLFDREAEAAMGHIELARWADLVLVAPASADVIAKIAHGFAQDLLTTLCLATTAPLVLAPAMNQQMWLNAATQANIQLVQQRNINLWGPAEGSQACGETGPGRMLEPAELVEMIANLLTVDSPLAGKRLLITAGPTQEALDPVRYLSNHSSGKMGYAVAEAAVAAGAQVTVVSGPVSLPPPAKVQLFNINSALEMYNVVQQQAPSCDIFIAAAAVADYRCAEPVGQKMTKLTEEVTCKLVRNPDILGAVAALPKPPFTVGFAAQTHEVTAYAQAKLANKKLDMIAANQVGVADIGFNSDNNALTVIWADGQVELPKAPKTQIAKQLIMLIGERYAAKHST